MGFHTNYKIDVYVDVLCIHRQKAWDSVRTTATAQRILDDASNDGERARLLSVSDRESLRSANCRGSPISDTSVRPAPMPILLSYD